MCNRNPGSRNAIYLNIFTMDGLLLGGVKCNLRGLNFATGIYDVPFRIQGRKKENHFLPNLLTALIIHRTQSAVGTARIVKNPIEQ